MTTPIADSTEAPAPPKPVSLWEDFIDIFYAPSTVYERRENANPWPMILIITVIFAAVTVLTFNSLSSLIDAELRAASAKAMAANPQMTADALETGIKMQMGARRWGGVFFPLGVLISGLFVWLLAKILGGKGTYTKAMVVVTYASIIALVQLLVVGAQALVLDVSAMTTPDQLSLSAARFVDKAATSPALYAGLKMLDVFGIWMIVVMAIGVRVTGKTTKNTAITFGVIWFVVSALIAAACGARAASMGG